MHTWLSVVTWYYSAYFASVCLACLTQWAERETVTHRGPTEAEGPPFKTKTKLGNSLMETLLRYYPWKVDSFFKVRRA